MDQDGVEGCLSGVFTAGEDHSGNPEEDDIIAGNQHIGGIELLEVLGIGIGPAQGLEGLSGLGYSKDIAYKIAYDRTYNTNKYTLYDNIYKELEMLKEKYILILLTDNWPCVNDYFNKIYISSICGVEKKDKFFFDYPINEFNIKTGEALFIDDNELNLDIAKEKGFDVMLMDREKIVENSKHKIINDLFI